MPMDTFHLLITIRYFPHSSSTGFVRWIARLMSHAEQELISLPEHRSSLPVLSGVRVAQSFVFCRYVKWDQWQLLQNGVRVITVFTVFRLLTDFVCLYTYELWPVCPFIIVLLVNVLIDILRFKAYDNPFGIFKLFLNQ
jgi:hypothetical protein